MYLLELGGEDDRFAAREAAPDAELVAPGLATVRSLDLDRVRHLAYTHRASDLLGTTDASVESAEVLLEAAATERSGSVAVRARNIRDTADVSTREAERTLGGVLVDRGFSVDLDDPDHELRVVFSGDRCFVGWLAAASVRDFGSRLPTDKPFFQPGSMDPLLARAIANIAGAGPDATILDPMCGTGGVLVEAGLVGSDVFGTDAQWKMVRGALENLAHFLPDGTFATVRGDATHLPLRDGCVDAVVFDAPYGRQSKIANLGLDDLVAGALSEAHRVADRTVVVADRDWTAQAEAVGWTVESTFERRVHRSLDRHIAVLEKR